MTIAELAFALLASICVGAAIVSVTRTDARSALVALTAVLVATAALLAVLGATIAAISLLVAQAIGATIPLIVAVGRSPALRGVSADRGRPRLALAAALMCTGTAMLIGVALLRTALPDAVPAREAGPALDALASEIAGRRAIVFAALLMLPFAALIVSGAARRPRASER